MNYKARLNALAGLAYRFQLCFAARCVDRAIEEARQHCPSELALQPSISDSVECVWKYICGESADYSVIGKKIHSELVELMPLDDNSLKVDDALFFAADAACSMMMAWAEEDRSAFFVTSSGGSMINLVTKVYKEYVRVEEEEVKWQTNAINELYTMNMRNVDRSILKNIPEYIRGPISADYLKSKRI